MWSLVPSAIYRLAFGSGSVPRPWRACLSLPRCSADIPPAALTAPNRKLMPASAIFRQAALDTRVAVSHWSLRPPPHQKKQRRFVCFIGRMLLVFRKMFTPIKCNLRQHKLPSPLPIIFSLVVWSKYLLQAVSISAWHIPKLAIAANGRSKGNVHVYCQYSARMVRGFNRLQRHLWNRSWFMIMFLMYLVNSNIAGLWSGCVMP